MQACYKEFGVVLSATHLNCELAHVTAEGLTAQRPLALGVFSGNTLYKGYAAVHNMRE